MEPFHVCQTCYAVVLNEFSMEHAQWHTDLRHEIWDSADPN
jgi:hypothetical protein